MSAGRRRAALALAAALALGPPLAPGVVRAQESDPELSGARVEELERRFLRRAGEALTLDEDGVRRLGSALSETREARRRNAERRRSVRAELAEAATSSEPDPARIEGLLERWAEIQMREAEIFREEQRRLAEFLTPLQRARFLYLRQRFLQAAVGAWRDAGDRDPARPGERRRPAAARDRASGRPPRSSGRPPPGCDGEAAARRPGVAPPSAPRPS